MTPDEAGFPGEESETGLTESPGSRLSWNLGKAGRGLNALVSLALNLILTKPISIFAWWLYAGANRTTFRDRAELARRVTQARRAGRPVLFVSNHLSMFDDPVLPMALFRTGPRATAELALLGTLLILWQVTPPTILSPGALLSWFAACCLGSALLGARKTWWSTGDLINFSGVSALRSKMEASRDRPLSIPVRLLLALADPLIFLFMRSATVKTVLVDRRPGEESRQSRTRALVKIIDLAADGEQIWVFFEGGRTRRPDEIRPARAGIGHVIKGLLTRGIQPVLIAIHHRGLEQVMPMSSRRWFTSGHRIDVSWSEIDLESEGVIGGSSQDPQDVADRIRNVVVRLQSAWRSESALSSG